MSRSLRSSGALALLVLPLAIEVACNERFPKANDASPPPEPAAATVEPVEDAGTTLDPSVDGSFLAPAILSFHSITTAPLVKAIELGVLDDRIYVAEQVGRIKAITATTASTVLDISDKVVADYQLGLVGFAFHPKFSENGYLYVVYTQSHPDGAGDAGTKTQAVVARFTSYDGGLSFAASTEIDLLFVDQLTPDHGLAKLAFGPDGLLYIGSGDGAFDLTYMQAQNTGTLYGGILRIDVDNGDPYAIPASNPFAQGGGSPELYAWGLRNPWRFSFDAKTGRLFAGDPGQNRWEEINEVVSGGNYGWGILEGPDCFNATTCDKTGFRAPLVALDRQIEGAAAVIGGVFYHGKKVPSLSGKYIFADFVTGQFWSMPTDTPAPAITRFDEGLPRTGPTSFALDSEGEILFADYSGKVYRIAPFAAATP